MLLTLKHRTVFLIQTFHAIPFRWLHKASASEKESWLSFSLFNLRSVSSSSFLQLRILAISTGGWKTEWIYIRKKKKHNFLLSYSFKKLTCHAHHITDYILSLDSIRLDYTTLKGWMLNNPCTVTVFDILCIPFLTISPPEIVHLKEAQCTS
jgi:hypothetical protein